MRVKILNRPTQRCIDGVRLDQFVVGVQYEVGSLLAAYLVAEGWAEPVTDTEPAIAGSTPASKDAFEKEYRVRSEALSALKRELYPPADQQHSNLAADHRPRTRRT